MPVSGKTPYNPSIPFDDVKEAGKEVSFFYKGVIVYRHEYHDTLNHQLKSAIPVDPTGVPHGKVLTWDKDFKLLTNETFVNGKKHGTQKEYDWSKSSVTPDIKETEYKNGVLQTPQQKIKDGILDAVGWGVSKAGLLLEWGASKAALLWDTIKGAPKKIWERNAPLAWLSEQAKAERAIRMKNTNDARAVSIQDKALKVQEKAIGSGGKAKAAPRSGMVSLARKIGLGALIYLAVGNGVKRFNDRPNKDKNFSVTEMKHEPGNIGGGAIYSATVTKGNKTEEYIITDDKTVLETNDAAFYVTIDDDEVTFERSKTHNARHPYHNSHSTNSFVNKVGDAFEDGINVVSNLVTDATTGWASLVTGREEYNQYTTLRRYTMDNVAASDEEKEETIENAKILTEQFGENCIFCKREAAEQYMVPFKSNFKAPTASTSTKKSWQHNKR